MDVAVSGDRTQSLTQRLDGGLFLCAVATGFGEVNGTEAAVFVLERLREEVRFAADRMLRAHRRGRNLTAFLQSAIRRVNDMLRAGAGAQDDCVLAGASLTAALLVDEAVCLAHVGSTAAYLARGGHVVSLTKSDHFEGPLRRVLTCALGVGRTIDPAVCAFTLTEGDALVLARRRLADAQERARVSDLLANTAVEQSDHLLVLRRIGSSAPAEVRETPKAHALASVIAGVLATAAFYALLCLH